MIRPWLKSTFGWPLVLGVLNSVGLVGALLWDGLWDGLGALLLAASIGVIAWARLRRPS